MKMVTKFLVTLFLVLCGWSSIADDVGFQDELVKLHNCGLNSKAIQLAKLIIEHKKQQRQQLYCHPILAITAAKKAKSMASNQRVEHNLDFKAPNALLESHGYLLPDVFLPTSNQVESVAGGPPTPEKSLQGFLNSKNHRSHLLGLSQLNQQQIHIGVGYHYDRDTPYEHHWVVHIAQPRSNQTISKTTRDKTDNHP